MTRATIKTTKAKPDRDELLAKAVALPSKVKLSEYWDTVTLLREKDYSWREIATWLNEQGLGVHYKQLERYEKKRDALGSDVDADDEN